MRLIDPKDLLDYINEQKICGECESCTDIDCMNCFTTDLEDIPTIEAEPVIHAEWVERNEQTVVNGHVLFADGVVCSRCGYGNSGRNYCEYCGAKMDNAD